MKEKRKQHFAAAVNYAYANGIAKNQKHLSALTGISEDTLTNVIKNDTGVSEMSIDKLLKGTGNIFNIQYLRGESEIMLQKDVRQPSDNLHADALAPILAALQQQQADHIADLKQQLADEKQQHTARIAALQQQHTDEKQQHAARVADLQQQLADKSDHIADLQQQLADLRKTVAEQQRTIETLRRQLEKTPSAPYQFPTGAAESKPPTR